MAEYIEREAAEKILYDGCHTMNGNEGPDDVVEMWHMVQAIPSADVQPVRHGRWIFKADSSWRGGGKYECSACKYGYAIGAYHEPDEFTYCPHCGAKMDGGKT